MVIRMKQAIIDIGSNSIRLTLYETENQSFRILFREKIMAGLAGYVENGKLSAEGIECACAGLLTFRSILQTLEIGRVSVFATAFSRRRHSAISQIRSRHCRLSARLQTIRWKSFPAKMRRSSATLAPCGSCVPRAELFWTLAARARRSSPLMRGNPMTSLASPSAR